MGVDVHSNLFLKRMVVIDLIDAEVIAAIEKGVERYDAVEVKKVGGKIVVVGINRKVTLKSK